MSFLYFQTVVDYDVCDDSVDDDGFGWIAVEA